MDKIRQINSIFKTARSQLSRQTRSTSVHSKKQGKTTDKKIAKKIPSAELKKNISKKLKLLDKKNENYEHLSNEVFLESVLLWEFGDDIVNDPAFHPMLDKINNAICDDRESSRKFSLLIKQLTQS
ncbi:hypothetical protein MNBD_GAMMA08-1907 [hydrothermal vent metagenome]|uniref:Uncharacterized protein n=1 Tax=hydrothermal vent metagenome TaxID=652676 RepID=A0A3B0Y1B2_9ZZZZ